MGVDEQSPARTVHEEEETWVQAFQGLAGDDVDAAGTPQSVLQDMKVALIAGGYVFLASMASGFAVQYREAALGDDRLPPATEDSVAKWFAVGNVFFAPVYGRLADTFGRRPFFMLYALVTLISQAVLYMGSPMTVLVARNVLTLFQTSFVMVWAADQIPTHVRLLAAGMLAAFSSTEALARAIVACTTLPNWALLAMSAGLTFASLAYALCFVHETVKPHHKQDFHKHTLNPFHDLRKLLGGTPWHALLATTAFFSVAGLAADTQQEMLEVKLNATAAEFDGALRLEEALIKPLFLVVLLPVLDRALSGPCVLGLASICLAVGLCVTPQITSLSQVRAVLIPLAAASGFMAPTTNALASNVRDHDEARRLALIGAVEKFITVVAGPYILRVYTADLAPHLAWFTASESIVYSSAVAAVVTLPFCWFLHKHMPPHAVGEGPVSGDPESPTEATKLF
eukprot:TRINITY_DN10188_c0_g2_i1.p1 TRINITY_DN10188_c0_g2~~TRINITY_DN10188_c0_g2_i1.p1  ORF type:complete len:456 (+),score=131.49 TRINITY_DN10188_c0_g2_i1:72-1439(+)